MAYLYQPDYVRYVCSCGSLKPISKIYFCRHCLKIRCGYCVCQEVDSYYCPRCLENLPSSEARLKKSKCLHCFDCPCCFQTLSTRTGHAPQAPSLSEAEENKDAKVAPKKVYYLYCSFCRWSSRDAGIPDQSVATGGWPKQENPHTTRINALIDYHKILASREKQQRERKTFQTKQLFKQITAFGLTSVMLRKRFGLHSMPPLSQSQSTDQPPPAVASEEVEELPPEIFTEPIDVTKITTPDQRLQHPEMQAEKVNELRPQQVQFRVKRSQRCRVCEHNVSKPDLSSQSTKFKVQLAAYYHVPEVKIVTCEPLRSGKASELLLKFCNPTLRQTQITLLSYDTSLTSSISTSGESEDSKQETVQTGCESPNLLPSFVRQVPVTAEPKVITVVPNAELSLPHSSIILPARDDAAEYDDTGDVYNFQDDPKLVVWRKGNKVVIRLHVTPHEIDEQSDKDVIVGFVLQYGYVNTILALENKTLQKLDLRVKLFLTVGKLLGTL